MKGRTVEMKESEKGNIGRLDRQVMRYGLGGKEVIGGEILTPTSPLDQPPHRVD